MIDILVLLVGVLVVAALLSPFIIGAVMAARSMLRG